MRLAALIFAVTSMGCAAASALTRDDGSRQPPLCRITRWYRPSEAGDAIR